MSREIPKGVKPGAIFTSLNNIITVQPVSGGQLDSSNAEWNTEFFKSCDPVIDGVLYCLCGCYCAGRLHGRAGEHFFSCCLPGATQALRTKIRMAYGIRGSLAEDCLTSCLTPCFLMQMKKELDQRGVPDPYAIK